MAKLNRFRMCKNHMIRIQNNSSFSISHRFAYRMIRKQQHQYTLNPLVEPIQK